MKKTLQDLLNYKKVAMICKNDEEAKLTNSYLEGNGGRNLYHCWEDRASQGSSYIDSIGFCFDIPSNTYCYTDWFLNDSLYFVVYASDYIEELRTSIKPKFVVGAWYKTVAGSYVKYKKTSEDSMFVSSESIMWGSREYSSEQYFFGPITSKFEKVNLSDIQEWLPEGHPDKITKNGHSVLGLIEDAKQMFPVGTTFKDLVNDKEFTVRSGDPNYNVGDGTIYIPVEPRLDMPNKTARIYNKGQWAAIVIKRKMASVGINRADTNISRQWVVKVTPENADKLTEWKLSKGWEDSAHKYDYISCFGDGINDISGKMVMSWDQFRKSVLNEDVMDDFKLPANWVIQWKNEEIFRAVNKYEKICKREKFVAYYKDAWSDERGRYLTEKPDNISEITFEQFKKYVLKDNLNISDKANKKWCIRGCVEMEDWQRDIMKNECDCSFSTTEYYYLNDINYIKKWNLQPDKPKDRVLISFNEFKQISLQYDINGELRTQDLIEVPSGTSFVFTPGDSGSAQVKDSSITDIVIPQLVKKNIIIDYKIGKSDIDIKVPVFTKPVKKLKSVVISKFQLVV